MGNRSLEMPAGTRSPENHLNNSEKGGRFFERYAPTFTILKQEAKRVRESGGEYAKSCSLYILPRKIRSAFACLGKTVDPVFFEKSPNGNIKKSKTGPERFLAGVLRL